MIKKKTPATSSIASIEDDPYAFMEKARIDHLAIEGNYRTARYAVVQTCAELVSFARKKKNRSFRKAIQNSEFWNAQREKPVGILNAKWFVLPILDPKTTQERATAGRYSSVVEFFITEGVEPTSVAAELKERGGIDKVYAASTGRLNDRQESSAKGDASKQQYTKDDLHASWSHELRDAILEQNGEKLVLIKVSGNPDDFKKVRVLELVDK